MKPVKIYSVNDLLRQKERLDRIYNRLRPTSDTGTSIRKIVQSQQRSILTPKIWRKLKSNVQTLSGRSFVALRNSFEKNLQNLVNSFIKEDLTTQEFKLKVNNLFEKYYKKAYVLGLKASGLGISSNYNTFSRLSKLPLLDKKDYNFINSHLKDAEIFFDYFVENRTKEIPPHFYKLLQYQYDIGRLNGAPSNSLVYWKKQENTSCKLCSYMEQEGPWPTELIPILPFNCRNCYSNIRIIPRNNQDYTSHYNRIADDQSITLNIKNLLVKQN